MHEQVNVPTSGVHPTIMKEDQHQAVRDHNNKHTDSIMRAEDLLKR